MRLLDFLFPERRSSALIAKDRLKIVLAHERANRDAPDFLPMLQQELIEVVSRYVEIRSDMIHVNLGRSGETSLLEINVELDGAQVKPARSAAVATPPPRSAPPRIPAGAVAEAPWVKPG